MNSENNLKRQQTEPSNHFIYDFVKITGAVPSYLWLRPKFYYPFGKPNRKSALLVAANHHSYSDPVAILLTFPFRRVNVLASNILFNSKVKRFFFTQTHCIEVDRDNFNLSSFHEVVRRLEEGKVIAIFPEGQLNDEKDDSILAFKSGAVLMAHRAGASILPVYLSKRTRWYHRQRIVVGAPIQVGDMLGKMPSMQGVSEITELLREKEIELRTYLEETRCSKDRKKGN